MAILIILRIAGKVPEAVRVCCPRANAGDVDQRGAVLSLLGANHFGPRWQSARLRRRLLGP